MSKEKCKELTGRGTAGKDAVVDVKDWTTNWVAVRHVRETDGAHVASFVVEKVQAGATVYTDEATEYSGLGARFDHETVNHSVEEYVGAWLRPMVSGRSRQF